MKKLIMYWTVIAWCFLLLASGGAKQASFAQGGQTTARSVQIVSAQKLSKSPTFRGKALEVGEAGTLVLVRLKVIDKPEELVYTTSLDFTVRYQYRASFGGSSLMQQTVKPCLGLRWHGPKIDESKEWTILFPDERSTTDSVFVSQISSGSDFLDVLFLVHKEAQGLTLRYVSEIGALHPARPTSAEEFNRVTPTQDFLIVGTVVDSKGAPVADKPVYLFPVRADRVTMTLKLEGGRSTGILDPSAKTNAQGKFTIKVPEDVFREGSELTIGVPERGLATALERDGKPLTFRIADRSTGKLDLGQLTLYCPNCSPW